VLRAAHGHVSPGAVVEAVTLLRRAQTQISRSTDTAGSFGTSLSAARELLWLEDHEAALGARAAAHPVSVPPRLRQGIELRDVSFVYPGSDTDTGSEPVLGPLSLSLPAGSSVALVGENGAGKTTLVKLLCGMYPPREGEILVDGVDLAALDIAAWRERVSAAFQDFVRFELPLRESVGVGDLAAIAQEPVVNGALARAGAGELPDKLPDGIGTRVGSGFTGGRQLSGGQWQRLALARGLMRPQPLLVVLDEPTAALDAPTEHALFDRYVAAARELGAAHGTITLLVSHRFSTVRAADLIIVLEHGRLREAGSHEALMSARGAYAELFALQARAYA
jgi:ATP-binding cassette subfamily B protein